MLQKFFNPDHPINRFFSKIFCILYLNILWLLCSLPIVTIGPATTALYYTMLKVVSGDDSSTTSYFFHAFRQNFRQGTILGIASVLTGLLLFYDLLYYVIAPGRIYSVIQIFQIFIIIFYLMIVTWLFAVLAKFDNTIFKIIQSAFYLAFRYTGYSVIMIISEVSLFFIMFFYVPLLALWGMGLIAFVNCICFHNIFSRYLPSDNTDISDPSHWDS